MNRFLKFSILLVLISCTKVENKKVNQEENSIKTTIKEKSSSVNSIQELKVDGNINKDTLPKNLSTLLQKNYSILNVSYGDANLDGLIDKILVIKKNTEEITSDYTKGTSTKRPFLLLLKQVDHSYKIAYRNDNAIYCIDCGGRGVDPFKSTSIKNGYFSIKHEVHEGMHYENTITFKYNKLTNNWFLYKDHFINYSSNDSKEENAEPLIKDTDIIKTTKDFGNISFKQFNIYQESEY